jgi:hypothetical protein
VAGGVGRVVRPHRSSLTWNAPLGTRLGGTAAVGEPLAPQSPPGGAAPESAACVDYPVTSGCGWGRAKMAAVVAAAAVAVAALTLARQR